jgi:glycosyltransferase involved in cell wall biosynthesis
VEERLRNECELALTPHITRPLQDGHLPDDISIMKSGIWNLGFAAMRRSPDTVRLVDWWGDRCLADCRSSVEENIFTDQRWMDLAPCFVERTALIRDPGYNLAYWNLGHRPVSTGKDGLTADGVPVTFVHFSGIVPDDESVFSKHQNRFQAGDIGALRALLDDYRSRLLANDWKGTSRLPYSYGFADDGRRIHDLSRRYFRTQFPSKPSEEALQTAGLHCSLPDWTDGAEPSLLALGPPYLSRLVFQCWTERKDLHSHFAVLSPEGRRGLLNWFANSAKREFGVDEISSDRAKRVAMFGPGVGVRGRLRWPSIAETFVPLPSRDIVPYLSEVIEFQLDDGSSVKLPRAFALLWELRRDLQNAFPLAKLSEWQGFLKWCYETGPMEGAFDRAVIAGTLDFFRAQGRIDNSTEPTLGALSPHIRYSYDGSFGGITAGAELSSESSICALTAYYVYRYAKRLDWPDEFVKPQRLWLNARDSNAKGDVPISRLLTRIYRTRPDLMRAFDLSREKGALGLMGWFLIYGFQEYALDERVLDIPVRAFLASSRYGQANNLACCVWAAQLELVEHKDLSNAKHREDIAEWYRSVGAKQFASRPAFSALAGAQNTSARMSRAAYAISGYIGSASGRGEDVRMTKRALETARIKPLVIDRAVAPARGGARDREEHRIVTDINICHFNAESAYLDSSWHRSMGINSRYSIGYWAWELATFPDEWLNAFLFYDEIWASTEFARAAFAAKSPRPVYLMPMVVENPTIDATYNRGYFGLPSDRFLFFFHFDFRSFVHRKNPEAAIRAFTKAFADQNEHVGLIIKTINGEQYPDGWERIRSLTAADPRIQVFNRELSRTEVASMIAVCDCYVSLHRSEGFGRGLAEAMLLEKPVIATGYSGNMDFCSSDTAFLVDYKLVPVREHEYIGTANQVWADADIDHAAVTMKAIFERPDLRHAIAKRGAEAIRSQYSPQVVGSRYAKRLGEIMQAFEPSTSGAAERETAEPLSKGRSARFGLFADKKNQ